MNETTHYLSRKRKYKKDNKINLKLTLVIVGLLISVVIFTLFYFSNDNTVYVDTEAQHTLDLALKEDQNMEFNMTEKRFINILHKMTHQKVESRDKSGSIQMTDDNIKSLLIVLDKNKYKHEELYKEILNEWKKKDFSNVVSDHNKLRKLMTDKDGRATSKMSKRSEEKFIEKNFTRGE